MALAKSHFSTLPPELLSMVANLITKPSDLKSLCMTCRWLNTPALDVLYRGVILDLKNMTTTSLNGFFLTDNPGYEYMKNLECKSHYHDP